MLTGIRRRRTTPYHPQANGKATIQSNVTGYVKDFTRKSEKQMAYVGK